MDTSNTLILATRNKGKMREFGTLLAPFALQVVGLDSFPDVPEIEETGITFEENALLKARIVAGLTGFVTLADDSGLEVDALGGAPGVFSARYSASADSPATDEKNMNLLLENMADMSDQHRFCRFRCCIAAATPDGQHILGEGKWEGILARQASGHNGFGYDPIFIDQEAGCTAAEMSAQDKNARSHRRHALQDLLRQWPAFWQSWLQRQ